MKTDTLNSRDVGRQLQLIKYGENNDHNNNNSNNNLPANALSVLKQHYGSLNNFCETYGARFTVVNERNDMIGGFTLRYTPTTEFDFVDVDDVEDSDMSSMSTTDTHSTSPSTSSLLLSSPARSSEAKGLSLPLWSRSPSSTPPLPGQSVEKKTKNANSLPTANVGAEQAKGGLAVHTTTPTPAHFKKEELATWTVKELKKLLREKGLSNNGTKNVLVERLL